MRQRQSLAPGGLRAVLWTLAGTLTTASTAHAEQAGDVDLGSFPAALLVIGVLYAVYEAVRVAGLMRGKPPREGLTAPSETVIRLARVVLVYAVGVALMWRLLWPMNWPAVLTAILWIGLATALTLAVSRVWPRPWAAVPALLVADVALIAIANFATRQFHFYPALLPLMLCAIALHVGLLARAELLRALRSRTLIALVAALGVLVAGNIFRQTSPAQLAALERPGIAMRFAGVTAPLQTAYVDPLTGYVYYVERNDPTKIHGVSPDGARRVIFQDRRERFVRLTQGYKPGRMLAVSAAPKGRSAFVMQLPDLDVQANYASDEALPDMRLGPATYYAQLDQKEFVATARNDGGAVLVHCRAPLSGAEPLSNMGVGCAHFPLPYDAPGPILSDSANGAVFTIRPAGPTRWTSRLAVLTTLNGRVERDVPIESPAVDFVFSPNRTNIYIGLVLRREIAYLRVEDLATVAYAPIHVHPTRLLMDPDGETMYVGSYLDGQVQLLNVTNGLVARPIRVGPALRDLTLDPDRQYLYAATDAGLIRVDLSLAIKPTGAGRMSSTSPSAIVEEILGE